MLIEKRNIRIVLRICLAATFLFCVLFIKAQNFDSTAGIRIDSIPHKKHLTLKPTGDFDQRFSFIEQQEVSIWGYRIGLLVNDAYKVGVGGYILKQELAGIKLDASGDPINRLSKNVYYGTIYFEPFLFRRKRWEMSLVFEAGYGQADLDSTNKIRSHYNIKTMQQNFFPAGMGCSVNFIIPDFKGFHFLTYLGLNGMIGLRKVIVDSDLKYNYDGWYWSIGSAIFIDKIFADVTGKGKKKVKVN